MIKFLVLICLVSAAIARTENWTGMRVKFGPEEAFNDVLHSWKVHDTLEEALAGRWKKIPLHNKLNATFVGVSNRDFSFTPLYDANGFLGGAQFCQPTELILGTGPENYDLLSLGTMERKKIRGIIYYCSTFLIVSPETLRSGGRSEMTTLGDGLWFRDTTDLVTGYKKIPDSVDELVEQTLFTKQNCIAGMGVHYFHNFTSDFDCNQLYNWFILTDGNDVVGIGWQHYGSKFVQTYNWYDLVTRASAATANPNTNECVYDWTETYNFVSAHLYFKDDPWTITCSDTDGSETAAEAAARVAELTKKWNSVQTS